MKRIAATAAFLLLYGSLAQAATLMPTDPEGLNVRAGPGTNHAIVGGLPVTGAALVLGREGDWYRVRLSSGTEGWVSAQYSRVLLEDEQRYGIVDTDVLNVRREPSLTAPVLTRITQGQTVRLLEMIPEWWRVRLDDSSEGWVAAQYMRQTTAPPTTPATPPTVPVTPPTSPPAPPAPAATPPTYPLTPPSAPAGTVPDLAFQPPRLPVALPGKVVQVKAESGIFAGPNSEARRVDTVRPGEALRLLDASGGWLRTETPRGKRGWIPGSLVQVIDGALKATLNEISWVLEATAPAPVPTPAPPPSAGGAEIRAVKDPDGLNLRLVPTMTARVLAALPQGEQMEVLGKDGRWLRVMTSSGMTGWVHGDFTVVISGPVAGEEQTPAPEPVVTGEGFKVSMEQPGPGISRLTVQTGAGKVVGQPVQDGSFLVIPFETGIAEERVLPLNILGVRQAFINPAGLKLELAGQPDVAVEQAAAGGLSVVLRPVLQGIAVEQVDGKAVYRLDLNGYAVPSARAEGANVVVDLPGAVLRAPIATGGAAVASTGAGVRISIPSQRAFALKRDARGFYLVLYPAGLAGKAIILDPGHGGDDGGAVSRAQGVAEKEVNLQVALRVRALLEARGAVVYMTRASDRRVAPESFLSSVDGEPRDQLDMQYRTMIANALRVDSFISIHHNSGEPGLRGTEVFYTSTTLNGDRSRILSQLIQEELVRAIGTTNRGAKDNTYFVTRNTDAPAALVEVAFINDPLEGPRTKDPAFQDAVANAIVRALERLYAER